MSIIEVKVPDIGDFSSVEVIEVLVAVGDHIKAEQSLITLESDKAAMEIPSPAGGIVTGIKVKVGDKIAEGSVILMLDTAAAQTAAPAPEKKAEPAKPAAPQPVAAAKPAAPVAATPAPQAKPSPTASIDPVKFSQAHASPSVRKFARELGVDLSKVSATGNKGRILQQDVQAFVKQMLSTPGSAGGTSVLGVEPMPVIDFSQWGAIEVKPLSKINKLTGKFLHRNWVNIPHVTQFEEADITDLEAFRVDANNEYKDRGIKFTMLAFIMKAVVAAMQKYPRFSSSLDATGENLVMKNYFHVGIAVDTPDGLVVPVIRDVDKKGLVALAQEMKDVSLKARDKKLKPSDMQGGCISISSLGGIGGTKFTPIVNAPEVAILGVSRADIKPVWNGKEFAPRLMLPLSLSYDHRVIDGADAARFTTYLSHLLSDARRLLM
jgi:pyruvate dehydrogenase E2 component (dihydrolipoamide acetyltransferase)